MYVLNPIWNFKYMVDVVCSSTLSMCPTQGFGLEKLVGGRGRKAFYK